MHGSRSVGFCTKIFFVWSRDECMHGRIPHGMGGRNSWLCLHVEI